MATILFSPCSACALFVIAGMWSILGEVSISSSLEVSYLVRALVRVSTIFQVCRYGRFDYKNYVLL